MQEQSTFIHTEIKAEKQIWLTLSLIVSGGFKLSLIYNTGNSIWYHTNSTVGVLMQNEDLNRHCCM